MKKRQSNMYINYEKSYRRRGRNNNKGFKIVGFIILLLGIVAASYYGVQAHIRNNPRYESEERHNLTNQEDVGTDPSESSEPNQNHSEEDNFETGTEGDNGSGQNPDREEDDPIIEEEVIRTPVEVKGVYAKAAGPQKIAELIEIAETTEINAVVIDIKDDMGRITYDMDSDLVREIDASTNSISDIQGLVQQLKEKGIYTIARIVAFKDPYLAEQRHELAIKNQDGSMYRDNNNDAWVNPYQHEVWEYLIEVSSQAAAVGFDEINFDYIRFSTGKGISEANFGEEAEEKTKEDVIIEFTKYAYEQLKPLGVFISADVYGTIISSSIDAGLVGQNYVEMSKYLDYICPMIYPSHFGEGNYGVQYPDLEPFVIIRKVLHASKTKLSEIPEEEHRAIVRPWLQDFTASWIKNYQVYGGQQLREQIDGVYEAGYKEWLLWNAAGNYSVDGLLPQ